MLFSTENYIKLVFGTGLYLASERSSYRTSIQTHVVPYSLDVFAKFRIDTKDNTYKDLTFNDLTYNNNKFDITFMFLFSVKFKNIISKISYN